MNWSMTNHKHYAQEQMQKAEKARTAQEAKNETMKPRRWWNR